MNPSHAAIAWIQAQVAAMSGAWAGNTNAQIVAALNTPSIANPVPQGKVPVPYTAAGLLGLLSPGSITNLASFPAIHDLFADIEAQSTVAIGDAVALLAAAGKITTAEATAVNAALAATEPDPTWQSQISLAQANLGRPVDLFDVEAARG